MSIKSLSLSILTTKKVVVCMDRHLRAVGIKFVLVSIVILSLFGIFYHVTFNNLLFMCLVTTGVSYGIGDLLIYPRLGNLWSTVIDSITYFAVVWTLSFFIIGVSMPLTLAALAATYFLTIAEPLFHTYMKERVYLIEDKPAVEQMPLGHLQMEMSEEIDDPKLRGKNEKNDLN